MTTTESTLPPLVAAKLRRLLGVEPTDPIPDRITPRQAVTLHHGQRVTIANKSAWNDCADIHDALMASGIVETETKTVVIDTGLFRPIPLATIGSTEWRAEFSRPTPAIETTTHTVVTRAALAEWWPCLGIEPGALLAAWMAKPERNDGTAQPAPTVRPESQQRFQELEILRTLERLGYDPKALERPPAGTPGPKKAARTELPSMTEKVFDKAWERLRRFGDIADA